MGALQAMQPRRSSQSQQSRLHRRRGRRPLQRRLASRGEPFLPRHPPSPQPTKGTRSGHQAGHRESIPSSAPQAAHCQPSRRSTCGRIGPGRRCGGDQLPARGDEATRERQREGRLPAPFAGCLVFGPHHTSSLACLRQIPRPPSGSSAPGAPGDAYTRVPTPPAHPGSCVIPDHTHKGRLQMRT